MVWGWEEEKNRRRLGSFFEVIELFYILIVVVVVTRLCVCQIPQNWTQTRVNFIQIITHF